MKTKRVFAALLFILISSCGTPKYLPSSENIDVNPFGSYIRVYSKEPSPPLVKGELIAIDTSKIIVLTDQNYCITVPIHDVKDFELRYAKPNHYAWTIPLVVILPFINGYYSALTIPLHLAVTISVTASGESAFQYSDRSMTYEKLKMFARFPQGIPPNVDITGVNKNY